ncbi:MAG TPA: ABC transporter substrate-binding protein [Chloroflexota bacterium]|nr:ABC transporter substrate-binding protein [Chloroflexota bacterium]
MARRQPAPASATAGLGLGLALLLSLACRGLAPSAPQAAPAARGALAAPAPTAAAQPPPEPVKLKFHVPSRSTSYLPWYIATERGYFQEQNLDVELVQIAGTTGYQAMIGGEMDLSGAGSLAIPALVKGSRTTVIFAESGRANYWLVTRPDIETLADLRGKRIVVPTLGASTYYLLAVSAVRSAGLDPDRDVQFVAGGSAGGGGSDILVGSLVAGLSDAMPGNILQRLAAEEQGFHTIYSFAQEHADLQGGVSIAERLRAQPDVVRRFAVAAVKSMRVMEHDPDTSLDVLLKWVDLDREAAAKGLNLVRPLMAKDGLLSEEEQRAVLAELKPVFEITEDLQPAQVFDFSYLEQAAHGLDASGWQP